MSESATPTGKRLVAYLLSVGDRSRAASVPAIEQEAAAAERERLLALYMATDAGEFCNIDVRHQHQHHMCNARCWCSWADPDNCPYPDPEAPNDD